MFDKELAEKFHNHIRNIPLEELSKRAENSPSSGMGSILDEYIENLKHIEGSGIGVANALCNLNNIEVIDNETFKLMVSRLSDTKPLDPKFSKILNDNILELF